MVEMDKYNGISLKPPGFYTTNAQEPASSFVSEVVPLSNFRQMVELWSLARDEVFRLRERIAVLEQQVAERGV